MRSLAGKRVMITGATDGLGKAVAMKAAKAGATIILHGRNNEKGNAVVSEIKDSTGNGQVFYYNADFASLEEVKRLSKDILADHNELHILINNAAIGGGPKGSKKRELSKDGYELRFAVNYLSHFLLIQNLLPLLTKSAPAKIINVSSIGQSPIDFSDLMMEKNYESFDAYCRSKLAQIIHGFTLSEKLDGKNITVNSLHPATLMDTNMVHDFFGRVSSTVEEGADVVEHVAFSRETEDITGAYFNQKNRTKANAQAYDEEARLKLWKISTELTEKFYL